jgi:hypothetical protein
MLHTTEYTWCVSSTFSVLKKLSATAIAHIKPNPNVIAIGCSISDCPDAKKISVDNPSTVVRIKWLVIEK